MSNRSKNDRYTVSADIQLDRVNNNAANNKFINASALSKYRLDHEELALRRRGVAEARRGNSELSNWLRLRQTCILVSLQGWCGLGFARVRAR